MKKMSFEEAVEYYRDKVPMTVVEYAALVAAIGKYAASQAFTVAGIASADVLQALHDEVRKAIEEGGTFWDFREGIDGIMERLGWEGLAPYRLDNIFRTNIQNAYNVGRYKQMKAIAARRTYWEYDAVNDSHTRPSHLAHDGKIYHHEHPFWDTWYPPNGYRCFPPWTKVMTISGWQKISSILPDDRIIGGSGDEKRVTAVHRNRFYGQLIRLIFENGRIDATPNHRILTMRGWVRADELNTGDILVETIPLASIDSFVGYENMPDSQGGNSGMAVPLERKPAGTFATNGEIQGGDKHVQPFRADGSEDDMIVNSIKTEIPNVSEHHGLGPGRGHFAGSMFRRVSSDYEPMRDGVFLPDFRPSGGGIFSKYQSEGISPLISILGFSEMPVESLPFSFQIDGSQLFSIIISPFDRGMEPLGFDGIAALSRLNLVMPDDPDKGVIGNLPAGAEHSVREFFFDIKRAKGLSDGAPLNRFDTLDDFRTWAGSHCILREITDKKNIPYNDIVVNLSVDTDESYVIQGATVHNCRCKVNSLSAQEMEEEGLKEETTGTDLKPDPGFEYNPAKQKWRPEPGRYDPQLRDQMEDAIWD